MMRVRFVVGMGVVASACCVLSAVSCGDSEEETSTTSPEGGSCESACWSGSDATRGVGACKDGMLSCDGKSCAGEVLPLVEDCDTPLDDDCDGAVNEEGCSCEVGLSQDCYSGTATTLGVGSCHAGVQFCLAGGQGYGPCEGEVLPASETCATPVDDDCDGETNEEGESCKCIPGATESCWSGPAAAKDVGACVSGTRTCNELGTGFGPCVGEVLPASELCATAVDDDCDGAVNEEGTDCACTSGATGTCYSGAFSTLGVGTCAAGTQTCNANGTGFGPCTGETLPATEVCTTADDEDCDAEPDCSGDVVWTLEFARPLTALTPGPLANVSLLSYEPSGDGEYDVVDPNGIALFHFGYFGAGIDWVQRYWLASSGSSSRLTLIGDYGGNVDLGAGPLPVFGSAFLTSHELIGNGVWSQGFVGSFQSFRERAFVTVAYPSNDPVLIAPFHDTIDLGNGPITGDPFYDYAIARYSSSTLLPLWSRRVSLAGTPVPEIYDLASAGSGSVLSGWCAAATDFGGGPLGDGGDGLCLARFDDAGQHVFSKFLSTSAGSSDVILVATPEDGNRIAVLARSPSSTLDLGGGPMAGQAVGVLSESGSHLWSKKIPYVSDADIAMDSQNALYITGSVDTGADFGGGPLAAGAALVKLDAAGNHVWSRNLPSGWYASKLAVSGQNLYFIGGTGSLPPSNKFILARVNP